MSNMHEGKILHEDSFARVEMSFVVTLRCFPYYLLSHQNKKAFFHYFFIFS